jgi:hypothetical protein
MYFSDVADIEFSSQLLRTIFRKTQSARTLFKMIQAGRREQKLDDRTATRQMTAPDSNARFILKRAAITKNRNGRT